MISILGALFLAILTSANHGYAGKTVDKPFNILERDTLAVESASNFGLAIKCLLEVVGDADTISAIHNALNGTVVRAQNIPAESLINKHYMDVVYEETSLSVASIESINLVCANRLSYCQHRRSDFKESDSPPEINELQNYLCVTGPMAKCLMRSCGEDIKEKIYYIFKNAVNAIRKDVDADTKPAQKVLLQAKYIATELLKLDDKCKEFAMTYDHCANVGQ